MPDLQFQITDVAPAVNGITPLLHFALDVRNTPTEQAIHSVLLQVQIQLHAVRRTYTDAEKARLTDLFGTPERWGQTLRNRLWTHASLAVPGFAGATRLTLPVPCTFDLNVASAKYFYALDGGTVPLLFLFSGTVFYGAEGGRMQIQQISWDKECAFDLPVTAWKSIMDEHYPNTAWLYLHRDVFERLYAFRRRESLTTWDETLARLLEAASAEVTP